MKEPENGPPTGAPPRLASMRTIANGLEHFKNIVNRESSRSTRTDTITSTEHRAADSQNRVEGESIVAQRKRVAAAFSIAAPPDGSKLISALRTSVVPANPNLGRDFAGWIAETRSRGIASGALIGRESSRR